MDPRTATTIPLPPTPVIPPPINTPENKSNFLRSKKGLLIIGGVLLLVIILVTGVFLFQNLSNTQKDTPKTTVLPNKNIPQDVKTYPKFQFTYQTPPPVTNPKTQLPSYTLKNSFSESELASFGAKFGFPKIEKMEDGYANYSDFKDPQARGFLVVNSKTGSFEYQAMAQAYKIQGTNAKQGAKNFLKDIGLSDTLTNCDITYSLATLPEITYVECHRSWEALGAPLLNLPGLLNISENTPLASLRLGYNDTPLENPLITNVSTGQNGVNRPNDFNTATFAIANDGTILSIASNLRWIEKSSQNNLITPEKAFTEFIQNKTTSTIAIPAGEGSFEWEKVFPEGTVTGKNATINDYELIYVENENGQTQTSYEPMYLIRGNILLDTGYRVNFVQTVPATATSSTSSLEVAQDNTNNNLQLQTFQRKPTNTPTPSIKVTNAPTPTPRPFDCSVDENIASSGPRGYQQPLVKFTVNINGAQVQLASLESYPNTFFVNQKLNQTSEVQQYKSEIYRLIGEQLAWNYKNGKTPNAPELPADQPSGYSQNPIAYSAAKGVYDALINNSAAVINPQLPTLIATTALSTDYSYAANPCYLTGLSPTVFLYSTSNTTFKLTPSYALYSDPKLINNTWVAKADKNGTLTFENFSRDFLYYEFNSQVTFSKQGKGFVVARKDLNTFINNVAQQMKLNAKEAERLHFEFNHALSDLKSDSKYIKVSLVPSDELKSKLPLSVSPNPEFVNRYHFLLEESPSKPLSEPKIPEVKRGESTLIELGASRI